MALSKLQKVGIVLGFIPGISTITGGIKAFIYFRRAKKHEKEANKIHQQMESKSSDIHQKALSTFKEVQFRKISAIERGIGNYSLVEMIPGFNIAVAFGSAAGDDAYPALSKSQQTLKELKKNNNIDGELKEYLINRYELKDEKDNASFMRAAEWIFVHLDAPSVDFTRGLTISSRGLDGFTTSSRTLDGFNILRYIPELLKKCREKSNDNAKMDDKEILASVLKEVIDEREEGEKRIKEKIDNIEIRLEGNRLEDHPMKYQNIKDKKSLEYSLRTSSGVTNQLKDLLSKLNE